MRRAISLVWFQDVVLFYVITLNFCYCRSLHPVLFGFCGCSAFPSDLFFICIFLWFDWKFWSLLSHYVRSLFLSLITSCWCCNAWFLRWFSSPSDLYFGFVSYLYFFGLIQVLVFFLYYVHSLFLLLIRSCVVFGFCEFFLGGGGCYISVSLLVWF